MSLSDSAIASEQNKVSRMYALQGGHILAGSDAGGSTRQADPTAHQPSRQHREEIMLPGTVQESLMVPLISDNIGVWAGGGQECQVRGKGERVVTGE